MHEIDIRRAERTDLPSVLKLIRQNSEWHIASGSVEIDESIVALNEVQQVVGWLMGNHKSLAWTNIDGYLMPEDWECSFVTWLLVDEQHKHQRIGSNLLFAFEEESSAVGTDTIVLSPSAGADEMGVITFYEKNGYKRVESGHMHKRPHGPMDSFPLPTPVSTPRRLGEVGEEAILEYQRILGVQRY